MGGPGSGPTKKSTSMHHGALDVPTAHASKGMALKWPVPSKSLDPIALNWYMSLQVSGQAAFYEQSDVAMAVHGAALLTLAYERKSAVMFAEFSKISDELLATAAMRKRMRIDLDIAVPEEPPSVGKLEKYRVVAGGGAENAG